MFASQYILALNPSDLTETIAFLKTKQTKKGLYQYMKLKLPVFVKLCQVFCPGVNMQPNFKLPQAEYQFLADTVM